MSTALRIEELSPLQAPGERPWSMRLPEVRRELGISLRTVSRRLRLNIEAVRLLEKKKSDLDLSDLWRYARALEVSPEQLIDDGRAVVFRRGNEAWSRNALEYLRDAAREARSERVHAITESMAPYFELIAESEKIVLEPEIDPDRPLHRLRELLTTEPVTVRTVARHVNWKVPRVRAVLRNPWADLTLRDLERWAGTMDIPTRILFRDYDDDYLEPASRVRAALVLIIKGLKLLLDVNYRSRLFVEQLLEEIYDTAKIKTELVASWPSRGKQRKLDDLSPRELYCIEDPDCSDLF